MSKFDFVATCSFGLEALLARELRELGMHEVHSDNGHVSFQGGPLDMARANLWVRTADRIWLRLGKFKATTFEELFQGVRALPWPDWLPRNACFPVEGNSHNSQLTSVPACQAITKKAVVEAMHHRYKMNWFPEDGPRFPIRVSLTRDMATLSLDTSGVGLHKRGYRLLTNEAPIRETLAAGMVMLSYWNKERILLDPFCGSGTILVEAAMIGLDRAPGWKREFASQAWPAVGPRVWKTALDECEERFDRTTKLQVYGSDSDGDSLRHARQNVARAELNERGIFFETRKVEDFRSKSKYGVVITNPPYGERMSERAAVEKLYAAFGEAFRPVMDTWSLYVITNHPEFARYFSQRESRRRKLYNGLLECVYYQYLGPRPPDKGAEVDPAP